MNSPKILLLFIFSNVNIIYTFVINYNSSIQIILCASALILSALLSCSPLSKRREAVSDKCRTCERVCFNILSLYRVNTTRLPLFLSFDHARCIHMHTCAYISTFMFYKSFFVWVRWRGIISSLTKEKVSPCVFCKKNAWVQKVQLHLFVMLVII